MIGLLSSEWLRMRSRRLVKVLAALALFGIVAAVVIGAVQSERPSADAVALAERRADRAFDECLDNDGFGAVEPGGDIDSFCEQQADPSLFLDEQPLRLSELPEILRGTSFVAILIGLVIGASAVGASWQTGTMTTILAWEPRRTRVALARAAVFAARARSRSSLCCWASSLALFWIATSLRGLTSTPGGWASETARRRSCRSRRSRGRFHHRRRDRHGRVATPRPRSVRSSSTWPCSRASCGGCGPRSDGSCSVTTSRRWSSATTSRWATGRSITPSRAAVVVAVYAFGLLAVATASFRIRDVQ